MRLWSYSALAGSVSVLAGGLVSVPVAAWVSRGWGLAVWAGTTAVLSTVAGKMADRFVV